MGWNPGPSVAECHPIGCLDEAGEVSREPVSPGFQFVVDFIRSSSPIVLQIHWEGECATNGGGAEKEVPFLHRYPEEFS
jgi:hypothetical protein